MSRLFPLLVILTVGCGGRNDLPSAPDPPTVADPDWIRPVGETADVPRWGHRDGLSIGLWPSSGPPGLFRIYAPYLGHKHPRMVNFVSVEPVAKGVRAQSELDISPHTGKPGLMFTAMDEFDGTVPPPGTRVYAPGQLGVENGVATLTVDVVTERFRNGTQPVIRVLFRADRPREVGFRVSAVPGSQTMHSCVLSATMGNYARLRRIWLADEVVDSLKLWPQFTPDRLGFAPWRQWPREKLLKRGDERLVATTPNEPDPATAAMPGVHPAWRYTGAKATQFWRTTDVDGLVARANGRRLFWASNTPIPGGVSFENVELEAPFREGQEFWFGVTTSTPAELGFPDK